MKTIRNRDVCLQQHMSMERSGTHLQRPGLSQPDSTSQHSHTQSHKSNTLTPSLDSSLLSTPAGPPCCHEVPWVWQPGRGQPMPCGQAARQTGGLLRAAEGRTAPGVGHWNGLPHQALRGAHPLMVKHDLQGSMYPLSGRLLMGRTNRAARCCFLDPATALNKHPWLHCLPARGRCWGGRGAQEQKGQQGMGSAGHLLRWCN